ncbi:hypothetical protein [Klebsiella phage Kpn02]|uniref:Uncharacterized protein n=1 Tax=Klebsiella phage Kpn02 TaxID=3044023 RepID=A0AAT9V626_9CAUD|nr:hypothetical protein [Klebsiella phage Kpn02]
MAGEVRFELTVIRLTGDRLYHLLLLSQICYNSMSPA